MKFNFEDLRELLKGKNNVLPSRPLSRREMDARMDGREHAMRYYMEGLTADLIVKDECVFNNYKIAVDPGLKDKSCMVSFKREDDGNIEILDIEYEQT